MKTREIQIKELNEKAGIPDNVYWVWAPPKATGPLFKLVNTLDEYD
jgi:hypothetical protein